MRDFFKVFKNNLIEAILPRRCTGCGKEGKYICEKCSLFLSEAPSIFPGNGLEELVSVWEYEGLIKKLIFKIKYEGIFDAIDELIKKAFEKREPCLSENTIITFVPMFKKKEKQRGFNQAELIAQKIGKMTERRVVPLLEKIKDVPSQTELNKEEREKNVKGIFRVLKQFSASFSDVLLVDDVWTSGATMNECCKVLRKAGVKKVWGFTIARTV